jgi:flagellar hook-basal body complex protein FliE
MARKKTAAAVATTPAKKTKSEDWTAGDRIGKLSLGSIRDMRITAERKYGYVECAGLVADFVRLAELLEAVMEQAHESESDRMIVAEELVDIMKRCEEQRIQAVDEAKDTELKCDDQIKDIQASKDSARQDHEEDMRAIDATCLEYRKRAELAEHQLAEAVRNGHGLDHEAREALATAEAALTRTVELRDKTIEALEQALAHARSINPMRTRKGA